MHILRKGIHFLREFPFLLSKLLYYSLKLANSLDSRSILNKLCSTATTINGIILSAEEIVVKSKVGDQGILRTFFSIAGSSEILKPVCLSGIKYLCDSAQHMHFIKEVIQYFNERTSKDSDKYLYPDYENDLEIWLKISSGITAEHGENVKLHIFLQEMDLTPKDGPLSKNTIRLQRIHTAKGMEFDHVFIIGLAEDQFPTYFAKKGGNYSIEEERRNCFVAVTRASKSLNLSYAKEYYGWKKEPSRFLKNMGFIQ